MASEDLKVSSDKIGQLYPILVDHYGHIVDGEHRFQADRTWRRITLSHIKTERDRLVARIVANNVRREVPLTEKARLLQQLGQLLLDEGAPRGRIARTIADVTGMSYRWVTKYLPLAFKDELQSERASRAGAGARRAAVTVLEDCLKPPKRQGSVVVKRYVNADFVSLTVEKRFYDDFEGHSLALGVPIETSFLRALEDYSEKMKRALRLKYEQKGNDETFMTRRGIYTTRTVEDDEYMGKWKAVRIKQELVDAVKKEVEKTEYKSLFEFVSEAIQNRLQELAKQRVTKHLERDRDARVPQLQPE